VLRKPDKLDEIEWRLVRTHPILGQDFSAALPFLPPASRSVIRHHHEQWDGNGYPDGLAGEAIPLPARIFSVCDVYDALTSERWYKTAWTHGGALAEIASQAGRKFDPAVVEAFIKLSPVPFPITSRSMERHRA
jgi:HD-GYP domain-containing protein (c-di-GMP phosphodiesterase class II)